MPQPIKPSEAALETLTATFCAQRGFHYALDPMSHGQDAYDITSTIRDEARVALEAALLQLTGGLSGHDALGILARVNDIVARLESTETKPSVVDLYYPVKNSGSGSGWNYHVTGLTLDHLRSLVSACLSILGKREVVA